MDDFNKTRNGGQGYVHKTPNMFENMANAVGNYFKPRDYSLMGKLDSNRQSTQSQLDQLK